MKIESINIKNFKGIKSLETEINGKNVYLIGGNATGKTSFIDAVWCGLTGKGLPPEPTHNGAKKGIIEIDLGDMIARTKFTKGKPARFELENKEYETENDRLVKSPRSYLESRVGILNFDINEFFDKSNLEQVKYFSKIMNIDFTDIDSEIEEAADSRKYDKKKLAEIALKRGFYDEKLAERDLIDIVELSKQIDAERQKRARYEQVSEGIETRKAKNKERDAEIEKLLSQIEAIKEEKRKAADEIFAGEEWLGDESNEPNAEELVEMESKLETANETNIKIAEAKEIAKAEKEGEEYEKLIEYASEFIEKKRAEKAERISKNIKIEGLKYDAAGERFLYDGLPFDAKQINTAAQLIAGMKIASSMLKDLKILKIDASLIDKVQFDKVLEWSEKNGIELFVELVDREAEGFRVEVLES